MQPFHILRLHVNISDLMNRGSWLIVSLLVGIVVGYTLEPLPYPSNALEPHISQETVEFHYRKHHQGYVNKLNELTKGKPEESKTLFELILKSNGAIFNFAAQIYNHDFYWKSMSPNGGGEPKGLIKEKINENFGSFEKFKEEFSAAATGHFGSGWAWLVKDLKENKLKIVTTHDAANPIQQTLMPILTCDVWEHAYYIDYRNARNSYVEAWWNTVNWEFASENLGEAEENSFHSKIKAHQELK